jgi:soluble lytic murein transglycosylase
MSTRRQRRRRRALLGVVLLVVVVAALVWVGVSAMTGRMVVPVVSDRIYPLVYEDEIAAVAEKYDLDPYLVAAVARTESGFDPDARSHAGAVGLMQLLPKTAEWVTSLDSWKGPDNPALTNPQDSLELGACYLAYLQRTLDDPTAAIAAYNAGQNAVRGWIKKAGGSASFGMEDIPYPETQEFVRRVERYRTIYQKVHPDAFAASSG